MKKLFIPKGESRHYESVESQIVIVEGCLKVEGAIKARHISGHGVVEAGIISSRTVSAMDIEAAQITAEKLVSERVCAAEVHISGAAVVSCRLEAQLMEAGKLTVADCEIGDLRCDDVVNLPSKHRGLLSTLLASYFRSLWCSWFCQGSIMDAEWTTQEGREQSPNEAQPQTKQAPDHGAPVNGSAFQDLEDDFEFKRLAALYRFNKGQGYNLRLIPDKAAVQAASLSSGVPHLAA